MPTGADLSSDRDRAQPSRDRGSDRDRDRTGLGLVGARPTTTERNIADPRVNPNKALQARVSKIIGNNLNKNWNESQGSYNAPVGGIDPQDRFGLLDPNRVDSAIDTSGLFGSTDPYETRTDTGVPEADISTGVSGYPTGSDMPPGFSIGYPKTVPPGFLGNSPVLDSQPRMLDRRLHFGALEADMLPDNPAIDRDNARPPTSGPKEYTGNRTIDDAINSMLGFVDDPSKSFGGFVDDLNDPTSTTGFDTYMKGMLLGTPISPAPLIGRALVEFLGSIGPEGGLTTEGSIDPRTGLVAKPGGEFTENKEKSYYGGKASNRGPNKERLINTVLDTPEILQPNFTDDQLTAILQQGFRNQVDNTFTDGALSLDQSIIDSIVNERLGTAQGSVANAGARGNLNTIGSANANEFLTGQTEAAGNTVSDIGGGVLSGNQGQINAIRDNAFSSINDFKFGDDLFDIAPFIDQRTSLIGDLNSTLQSDVFSALGSDPLFDVSEALRLGGGSQGLVSGDPSGTLLDTIAARESGALLGNRSTSSTRPSGSGVF